jgi:hypothetical protein
LLLKGFEDEIAKPAGCPTMRQRRKPRQSRGINVKVSWGVRLSLSIVV